MTPERTLGPEQRYRIDWDENVAAAKVFLGPTESAGHEWFRMTTSKLAAARTSVKK